jgi:hypothetical protein
MEELTLKRMKKDMSLEECLYAISDGSIGVILILSDVCKLAAKLLNDKKGIYGVLSMLDAMEIYGDDIAYLFSDFCQCNEENFLAIIWAYEIGSRDNQVPIFAKLETIKEIIEDTKKGRKAHYPFKEAKAYIRTKSRVNFRSIRAIR